MPDWLGVIPPYDVEPADEDDALTTDDLPDAHAMEVAEDFRRYRENHDYPSQTGCLVALLRRAVSDSLNANPLSREVTLSMARAVLAVYDEDIRRRQESAQ